MQAMSVRRDVVGSGNWVGVGKRAPVGQMSFLGAPAPAPIDIMGLGEFTSDAWGFLSTVEDTVVTKTMEVAHQFLRPVGAVIAGVHGYRRHAASSGGAAIGAALLWAAGGFLFPIIVPIAALIQGYAQPKEE